MRTASIMGLFFALVFVAGCQTAGAPAPTATGTRAATAQAVAPTPTQAPSPTATLAAPTATRTAPAPTPLATGISLPPVPTAPGSMPALNPTAPAVTVPDQIVQAIRADAVRRFGVDPVTVRILSAAAVDWNDSSLGCPQPGMVYSQVITPGYLLRVQAGDRQYEYHASRQGQVVTCS